MTNFRTERIHLCNILLQTLAFSDVAPDPEHLITVALVFEARGELLRLEDWGNPWLRQWPSRVSERVLADLVASYRSELASLPLYRYRATDPDASQMEFSIARRQAIGDVLLIIQWVALERGFPPVQISGFGELVTVLCRRRAL